MHAFNNHTGGVMFLQANTGVTLTYNATLSGTLTTKGQGYPGGAINTAGSGPGGGAVGIGGSATSPGSNKQAIMGSGGGGGAATGVGGNGGGVIILKSSGTLAIGGVIDARGSAATGNAGGGGGGVIIVSDVGGASWTYPNGCGTGVAGSNTAATEADKGAGAGSGTAGGDGRVFMQYVTQPSSPCYSASPAANATYWQFTVVP